MRRLAAIVALIALIVVALPSPAAARRFFRARFEPESMALQKPGELELDLQLGGLYGDGEAGSRLIVPDLELDLGITRWLELDVDAALSLTELARRDKTLVGDPVFVSARFDVVSLGDAPAGAHFGVGFQVGPRFRSVRTPRGVGLGALMLAGGGTARFHLVLNGGAVLDRGHPVGIATGLDWDVLVARDLSLIGDVSVMQFSGADPPQVLIDAGLSYKASPALELFALLMGGPFVRGDRAGALLGVAYSYALITPGS